MTTHTNFQQLSFISSKNLATLNFIADAQAYFRDLAHIKYTPEHFRVSNTLSSLRSKLNSPGAACPLPIKSSPGVLG